MSLPRLNKDDPAADVVLLLEGTYPMVRGGVAGWVDQLIRGLASTRFAIVFLGSRPEDYDGLRYELPDNVVHLECHYLMGDDDSHSQHQVQNLPRMKGKGCPMAFAASRELHENLKTGDASPEDLARVSRLLEAPGGLSRKDFLHSRLAWEEIVRHYENDYTETSFLHYFWSVRNMHAPMFKLASLARQLPRGRSLHAISTGYAGFLGAMAHHHTGAPLQITEHGIYTKERHIDLLEATWIRTPTDPLSHGMRSDSGYLRELWVRFFQSLGRMTYAAASEVTTLYAGNQQRQLRDGVAVEKSSIIPNGIQLERFRRLRERTQQGREQGRIVLIGRVSPIKDIKTFIRSLRHLLVKMPHAQGVVVGPSDENPVYAAECHSLAQQLMLDDHLTFLGFQAIDEVLASASLIVLTSISEAQPLVVLEAMAAGVPVVTTDVGACREMLLGEGSPEQAAGRVVPIASPERVAEAAAELMNDPLAWQAARDAGIERVEREYSDTLMLSRYQALYERAQRVDVTAAEAV